MKIEPATASDHDAVWDMLKPVFRAGDTYTVDPDITRDDALAYWFSHKAYIARGDDDDRPLGTYYIRPNQKGGGAHVCNCGFVTATAAQGKGVARSMLNHALAEAHSLGFSAMQFNFVLANNLRAVDIWTRAGFDVIGRQPKAFDHPKDGLVDALIMHRFL